MFWQSIEPGNQIETNTAIDLYISTGPKRKLNQRILMKIRKHPLRLA